ncbi:hypothetical protein [Sphingomonas yabuuchiae]|uniref:hypothetical protein n=1 Tax=Sphingomonas yabuuchiae TaxID=172044 RepID=UPI0019CFD755|nr:hypothetical protein [Sphingomonas yabuuchiae]
MIGRLLLVILPLIGLMIGGYLGGLAVGLWTALGGFAVAFAVCSLSVLALVKARPSR